MRWCGVEISSHHRFLRLHSVDKDFGSKEEGVAAVQ
ncbi:hypothetical protein A2U01_0067118, partial [Trifolium medium]|nr:hypothetical protein [Trifolium medium]